MLPPSPKNMAGFLSELDSSKVELRDHSRNMQDDPCVPMAFSMATGPDVASKVIVTNRRRRTDDGGHSRWVTNEKIAYAYELLHELGLTSDDIRVLVPKTQNTGTATAAVANLNPTNGRVASLSYSRNITGDPSVGAGDAIGMSTAANVNRLTTRVPFAQNGSHGYF